MAQTPSTDPGPGRADAWRRAAEIETRVAPPVFPDRWFDVTDHGAAGDGAADDTVAIRAAIETCAAAGGGHVRVPPGRYRTGAIRLYSGVDLHVTAGATLRFDQDTAAYPPVLTRWQGVECVNFSPFVYAYEASDIALTGGGVLDGRGDDEHWWPWKGKPEYGWRPGTPDEADDWALLQRMAADGVPATERVFGPGHRLRTSLIQPYRCRNVLIEGVTLLRSPFWVIHPVLCENVLVRGVTVDSHGPNNDGCDPESCTDVVIRDCVFDTGDDCIAIKAGRNHDGRRLGVPSSGIVVAGCRFHDGHGGLTIGSEMSGGVRDVYGYDLTMTSPRLWTGIRLKTNSARGGFITGVHVRDVSIDAVSTAAIEIDFGYEEGPGHGFDPVVSDLEVTGLRVGAAPYPYLLRGYPDAPIRGVRLAGCRFDATEHAPVAEHVVDLSVT